MVVRHIGRSKTNWIGRMTEAKRIDRLLLMAVAEEAKYDRNQRATTTMMRGSCVS
jgi:hypothetical protein